MSRRAFVVTGLILATPFVSSGLGSAAWAQSAQSHLEWVPCGDAPDSDCAGLQVPIDYADSNSVRITLRLGRAPAVDPANRRGVLLLLPGGPGAGMVETIGGEMRAAQHVPELQRQYDVVTFDPRGVGRSSPVRCD